MNNNEHPVDNIFTTDASLTHFEVFASDQPLDAPMTDDSPWTSAVLQSSDNEPWELDETRHHKEVKPDEFSMAFVSTTKTFDDTQENYFTDAFNPPPIISEEQTSRRSSVTNELEMEQITPMVITSPRSISPTNIPSPVMTISSKTKEKRRIHRSTSIY